jgi:hypothetical protein
MLKQTKTLLAHRGHNVHVSLDERIYCPRHHSLGRMQAECQPCQLVLRADPGRLCTRERPFAFGLIATLSCPPNQLSVGVHGFQKKNFKEKEWLHTEEAATQDQSIPPFASVGIM